MKAKGNFKKVNKIEPIFKPPYSKNSKPHVENESMVRMSLYFVFYEYKRDKRLIQLKTSHKAPQSG